MEEFAPSKRKLPELELFSLLGPRAATCFRRMAPRRDADAPLSDRRELRSRWSVLLTPSRPGTKDRRTDGRKAEPGDVGQSADKVSAMNAGRAVPRLPPLVSIVGRVVKELSSRN